MVFTWSGNKPVLPALLNDLPIISLEEEDENESEGPGFHLDKAIRVTRGESLHPVMDQCEREDVDEYGTLGFLLTMGDNSSRKHVVATVGHVLGQQGRTLIYGQRLQKTDIHLTAIKGCERFLGRPSFRQQWPWPTPGS
jgi:hypothetical protein